MSKSDLAVILSKLKGFPFPNVALEQYTTDADVAAEIVWDAYMNKDIEGKTLTDLGCGPGILGIGAMIMNAMNVCFVDKDEMAIKIAQSNLRMVEEHLSEGFEGAEFFTMDVTEFFTPVDTIIMNPPFGTRDAGADVLFLGRAMAIAKTVYSLHKSSTKAYIRDLIAKNGFTIFYEKEFKMPLKATMPQHVKKIERIDVVCFGMRKK
ncbi:MAG: METTL5 family protein [Nanoarchaeota archaeon]